MRTLLNSLFISNGFERLPEMEVVSFYQNQNIQYREFYLVEELAKQDFLIWNEDDNRSLTLFNQLKNTNGNIEKNTSLILAVKADNFQVDLPLLKNKILSVEEDAYHFKKYVIVYTDNSIQLLESAVDILGNLKDVLLNADYFNMFKENMCADEQYLATMQLFLKLPFLPTPVGSNADLSSIETLLNARLSMSERNLLEKLIAAGSIDTNLNWQEVRRLALLQDSNEEQINQFFSNFENNAQA